MKIMTMRLVLMLTLASAVAMAQTPSGSSAGHSATAPDPQAVPNNSANAGYSSANPAATPQSNGVLQSRIEDAMRNQPTLSDSHISVNVNEDAIDLSGTVGSTKDKQTAERIAESFDGNRKLNDKLVVTGHGHSDMAPDHSAMNNGGTGNAPNPAMNNSSSTPPKN